MKYSEKQLLDLRCAVKARMSEKRFAHTLGVEKMAAYMGERLLPNDVSELRAAAILHDVAKELTVCELLALINKSEFDITDEDLKSPNLYHSFAAPVVIKNDFADFVTDNILSAVHNHTAGAPDMSLFDQIIFLADFTEEGRRYSDCIALREKLISRFEKAATPDEFLSAFEITLVECMNALISALIRLNEEINTRTVLTRNSFLAKILQK